ncbi:MAG: hypothetical protein HZC28_10575 [Spirochaetes bacterium]|nr:hypothetical protein [Spirochaetota bacterium]
MKAARCRECDESVHGWTAEERMALRKIFPAERQREHHSTRASAHLLLFPMAL